MSYYSPIGNEIRVLEKNILKYRIFEMTIYLFKAESFKNYLDSVVESIKLNHSELIRGLELSAKKNKQIEQILVKLDIVDIEQYEEIIKLIDYRNDIAHRIHYLTADLTNQRNWEFLSEIGIASYKYQMIKKLEMFQDIIKENLRKKGISILGIDQLIFSNTEKVLIKEMKILYKKINIQFKERKKQNEKINKKIDSINNEDMQKYQDPNNFLNNGCLSKEGIENCNLLFRKGFDDYTISYILRLSLKSVRKRRKGCIST